MSSNINRDLDKTHNKKQYEKQTILFLCTGNSCRSQMAEGLVNHIFPDKLNAISAGIETHGLNPYAVKVMQEIGIDISNHFSKTVDQISEQKIGAIITVCDQTQENCPFFPGDMVRIHKSFEDPPKLAENLETEEEILDCYRKIRDEIRNFVRTLPGIL